MSICCHKKNQLHYKILGKRIKTWLNWFVIGVGDQYRASIQRH